MIRRMRTRRAAAIAFAAASVLGAPSQAASSAPASTQTFTNSAPIAIPASGTSGPASPYPSSVSVAGMPGPITDVNVTLHRFGHTFPTDVDVLLVSPNGESTIMMSDACGLDPIEDFTWILDQQAAAPMVTPCAGFHYQPTNIATSPPDAFPDAPPGPYFTGLDFFNNENANGTWSLYVVDDGGAHGGDIEGGWSLTVTTGPADAAVPGTGSFGTANPYPLTRTLQDQGRVITDLDVRMNGIWHQRPDDLDLLLVGPRGQKVVLASDACGTFEARAFGWSWDDEAPNAMPDGGPCQLSRYRPSDYEPGDGWPAPAPPGPYAGALSAFDLTDLTGDWRLFAVDDASDKVGFFTNRFELLMETRPKAPVAFTEDAVRLAEGATSVLTLKRSGPDALGAGTATVTSLPVSASSGTDFTPVSTVVDFAAGEREQTIEVEALADGEQEPDETFLVAIGSPTGDAATSAPSSVAVTIPAPATTDPPAGGPGAGPTAPAFGARTLVTLRLATRRVPAGGPVRVRVANANAFAVSGRLFAKPAGKGTTSRERRLALRSKSFTVSARAKKTVGLALPKALRKLLTRKHRFSLRLRANLRDPAGNVRTVTKTLTPQLKRKRTRTPGSRTVG